MNHKIGGHVLGSQRDGWGNIAPQLVCVVSVGESGAFDELDDRCIKIWRDQSNPNHVDAPGDFDLLPDSQLFAAGEYWFNQLYPKAKPIIDRFKNVYWQPTNEINNPRIVEYLRGFMSQADKNNVKLALFGDAGDSPSWDDWLAYWYPLLEAADAGGHIYSRHVYSGVHPESTTPYLTSPDGKPADLMTQRVFTEADYLYANRVNIPIVISELGWHGGHTAPPAAWLSDLSRYNDLMMQRSNIVGGALWTWGSWNTSPQSNLSGQPTADLGGLLASYDGPAWYNQSAPPPPPPTGKHKAIVLKAPQEITSDQWLQIADYGYDYRHTMTGSHDDTLRVLTGGRNDSYVKIVYPDLPSQQQTIKAIEAAGYQWFDVTPDIFPQENWYEGLTFKPVFFAPHQITSPFNAKRSYGPHEGVDLDIYTSIPDSKEPVRCIYAGQVVEAFSASSGYGTRVKIQSLYNGVKFTLTYAHLDNYFVFPGQIVAAGIPVGEIGSTGNSSGEHVHITMQVPGDGLPGYVVPDVIDPTPFMTGHGQPPPPKIDLLSYVMPSGTRQYIMKAGNGSQERYRPQPYKDGHLIQKGQQGEYYEADDRYIYLIWDTTPNAAEYYVRSETQVDKGRAPYLPRFMSVGEAWAHSVNHYVAFYRKSDCKNANSPSEGYAGQAARLIGRFVTYTTKHGATFNDVVSLTTGAETQYYAKGYGRIGWVAAWGESWATDENVNNQQPEPLNLPACMNI